MNTPALWQQLEQRGRCTGPAEVELEMPWSIRLMVGAGAWFGAMFVLGFLGALTHDLLEHSSTRLVLAVISLVAARLLAQQGSALPVLINQLALICAALMQSLVIWSIFDELREGAEVAAAVLLLSLVSLLVPLAFFRIWSGLLGLGALAALLDRLGLPAALAWVSTLSATLGLLWWRQPLLLPQHSLLRALAIAAMWGMLIGTSLISRLSAETWWTEVAAFRGAGSAAAAMTLLSIWLVRDLANAQRRPAWPGMLLVAMVGLASWSTPAVSAGLLLILLGFGRGERWMLGLGLLAMVTALSSHYYVMQWSLTLKSLSLVSLGVLLLSARWWLQQREASNPDLDEALPGAARND